MTSRSPTGGLPGATTSAVRPRNESPRRGREIRARPQTRKGDAVSATVLYMSMSLDGFMAGPDNDLDFMVDDSRLEDELTGMLMSVADTIVVGRDLLDVMPVGRSVLERCRRQPTLRSFGGCQRQGQRRGEGHRGGRHRPADLRARGRLGRRPPRWPPDLRPHPT